MGIYVIMRLMRELFIQLAGIENLIAIVIFTQPAIGWDNGGIVIAFVTVADSFAGAAMNSAEVNQVDWCCGGKGNSEPTAGYDAS